MQAPTNHHQASVSELGNEALLRAVATCAGHSRQALVRLLRGLGEVEARSLHAAEGFSSLYDYCRSLSFSESEAYKRCAVARASRRFPLLLVALESGSLHLTGAAMLVKHLTLANQQALLQQAAGMSKRALEVLLLAQSAGSPAATVSPRNFVVPQAPRLIGSPATALRAESAQPCQAAGLTHLALPAQPALPLRVSVETAAGSPHPPILAPISPSKAITNGGEGAAENKTAPQINCGLSREMPAAAEIYRLHVTLDAAALKALRQAQDLLAHRLPTRDLSQVLGMALQSLVERLQTQKFGKLKAAGAAKKEAKPQAGAPLTASPNYHPDSKLRAGGWTCAEESRGRCWFARSRLVGPGPAVGAGFAGCRCLGNVEAGPIVSPGTATWAQFSARGLAPPQPRHSAGSETGGF